MCFKVPLPSLVGAGFFSCCLSLSLFLPPLLSSNLQNPPHTGQQRNHPQTAYHPASLSSPSVRQQSVSIPRRTGLCPGRPVREWVNPQVTRTGQECSAGGHGDSLETKSQWDALTENVPAGPGGSCDPSLPAARTKPPRPPSPPSSFPCRWVFSWFEPCLRVSCACSPAVDQSDPRERKR